MKVLLLFIMTILVTITIVSQIPGASAENKPKKACPNYDGEWNDKKQICEIEDDEEKAAFEDYVCDDPDDSDRYPKVCKPWLFKDDE